MKRWSGCAQTQDVDAAATLRYTYNGYDKEGSAQAAANVVNASCPGAMPSLQAPKDFIGSAAAGEPSKYEYNGYRPKVLPVVAEPNEEKLKKKMSRKESIKMIVNIATRLGTGKHSKAAAEASREVEAEDFSPRKAEPSQPGASTATAKDAPSESPAVETAAAAASAAVASVVNAAAANVSNKTAPSETEPKQTPAQTAQVQPQPQPQPQAAAQKRDAEKDHFHATNSCCVIQ